MLPQPTFKNVFAVFLLAVFAFYGAKLVLVAPNSISQNGIGYFLSYFLHKWIPFLIFPLYLLHNPHGNKFTTFFSYGSLATAILLLPIALFTSISLALRWSFISIVTWNVAFLVFYGLTWWKTRNPLKALTFSILGVIAGGTIYEIPLFLANFQARWFYHLSYPLIIGTSWICILFFAYLLVNWKWKPNRTFYLSLLAYLVWSIIYVFNPHSFPSIIPRIPTILMLCSISLTFRREKKYAL